MRRRWAITPHDSRGPLGVTIPKMTRRGAERARRRSQRYSDLVGVRVEWRVVRLVKPR